MNWRDVLLGSIVTLLVTVIGSVTAYYLTREPPPPPPVEKIIYEIDTPVSFDSGQTKMSFFNVRVKNTGEKPATNVTVGVEFDSKVRISDQLVSLSSGPVGNIDTQTTGDNRLSVEIGVLTPDEIATIAILTDTADERDPMVGVKSDASAGKRASLNSAARVSPARSRVIEVVIAIAIFFQVVVLVLMRYGVVRSIRLFIPVGRSINDTAFVLLHSGLIEEAIKLLSKGISDAGADPIMLANYGLALGLNGDAKQAQGVLKAADFWAERRSQGQAVVAFNRSLLAFERGDEADGLELMRRAFEMSKKEISRYATYSTIVSRLREDSKVFRLFLDEHGLSGESG